MARTCPPLLTRLPLYDPKAVAALEGATDSPICLIGSSISWKESDMAFGFERPLDRTDWAILRELQRDARLSFQQLGRQIGLSGPATGERVRRLEAAGMIVGYAAAVDPPSVGYPIVAFIRMSCSGAGCIRTAYTPEGFPEVLELYRVSGTDCSLLKVVASSVPHLENLLDRLARYGQPTTSLVLSAVTQRGLMSPPTAAIGRR
jgi:Lrp/AsnC family leucine-responsive transcriptional regulator